MPSAEHLAILLSKDDFHAVVALDEESIVGGLTAYELVMLQEERELFIYDVAVGPLHRRRGVGSALIEFVQKLGVERGISALYVAAMADDSAAIRFYESTGLNREDVAWFVQETPRKSL